MKYIKLGNELEQASQLVLGCMRMAQKTSEKIVNIRRYQDGQLVCAVERALQVGGLGVAPGFLAAGGQVVGRATQ